MLSLFVVATSILGVVAGIALVTKNLILFMLAVLAIFVILLFLKRAFIIGLVVFFCVSLTTSYFSFKTIFTSLNSTFLNKEVEVTGTVSDYFDLNGENFLFPVETSAINGSKKQILLKVSTRVTPPPKGAEISFKAKIKENSVSIFSYSNKYFAYVNNFEVLTQNKFYVFINNLKLRIIKFVRLTLKSEEGNLLLSSVLGLNTLESNTKAAFQATNTAHIFAISGFNLAIIYSFINTIFKGVTLFSPLISLIFVFLFTVFIGFKFSVLRAFIMLTVLVLSLHLGRGKNLLNSLLVAIGIIIAISPTAIISVSFYLSCIAIFGLVVADKIAIKNKILKTFETSAFVSLFESPIIYFFFNTLSVMSLFLNVIVIPLTAVLLPMGIIFIIIVLISRGVAQFFAPLINFAYGILLNVTKLAASLDFAFTRINISVSGFVLLSLALCIFAFAIFKNRKPLIIAGLIMYFLIVSFSLFRGQFQIGTFNNAEAIMIKTHNKTYLVIKDKENNGGEEIYLPSFLSEMGIKNIDDLFILKDPSMDEAMQIINLKDKSVYVDSVIAVDSVDTDFIKAHFSNYRLVKNNFSFKDHQLEVISNNNSLRIMLNNVQVYPVASMDLSQNTY